MWFADTGELRPSPNRFAVKAGHDLSYVIRTRRSGIRLRSGLWEVALLAVGTGAGLYLAHRYNFFSTPGGAAVPRAITVDEGLLVGVLLLVGLAVIVLRRRVERLREAALQLATEEYVRTPEFQRALAGIVNRRKPEDTQMPPHAIAETK